jgi:two-component system, OmpR family, phosphate regulon sensor histidine kinase PhoR
LKAGGMNTPRRLIWQLYPSYLVLVLCAVLAVSWFATDFMRRFYLDHLRTTLAYHGRIMQARIAADLMPLAPQRLDRACKAAAAEIPVRFTVILPDGVVVADSEENPRTMDNHSNRPEIRTALEGATGHAQRYSTTLNQRMMYVAAPVTREGRLLAVLRTALPLTTIDGALKAVYVKMAVAGLLIAILAAGVGLFVSRRISRPLERMRKRADQYARGELGARIQPPATLELASLAEALNTMAGQLKYRMDAIERQRNELEAVLSSMVEGVIALDIEESVISLNSAAKKMFPDTSHEGRSLAELVRSHDLAEMVKSVKKSGQAVRADITYGWQERILEAHCMPLYSGPLEDSGGGHMGTLLVLHDVTQLRRLENIRRDFAANVSHEIKTPLTAIKGFVETLRDSDLSNPDESRRFLTIIARHVDRLAAIIDDLMHLSRIEQSDETRELAIAPCQVRELLANVASLCRERADAKGIEIGIDCSADLTARMDAHLMEQAVLNLLDNAIKYTSRSPARIKLRAALVDSELRIVVSDQGIGIGQKHLPRLFERFYRVDKARSRHVGGTGLGLAIVKHIVQAHGGKVSVESELGQGTTFTLRLPNAIQKTSV